jgi:hypothetical protein
MAMVQYGIMPNCSGDCDFCLLHDKDFLMLEQIYTAIDKIKINLDVIDWKKQFSNGISLIGGEIYFLQDETYQRKFLELIDDIINKIILVSPNPNVKFSCVTNGNYDPTFLYKVVDKIKDAVGLKYLDLNFSYDIKYRFKNEEQRLKVLKNINDFHKRYNYSAGVQMIMTQYLIDSVFNGSFNITDFLNNEIPGNMLCFLYPHPIHGGKTLPDFNFKRKDFFKFLTYLENNYRQIYNGFIMSTYNSAIFKYTGMNEKVFGNPKQPPVLSDGKQILNNVCSHSVLYQCYSDSNKCMLCDIMQMEKVL